VLVTLNVAAPAWPALRAVQMAAANAVLLYEFNADPLVISENLTSNESLPV